MSHLPSNPSEAFKRRNPQIYGVSGTASDGQDADAKTPAPAHRPKDKLNQLERDWLNELRHNGNQVGIQDVTLKLPMARHRYTPDFRVCTEDRAGGQVVTFYETKGEHRFKRHGVNALLAAAATHRWARFVLVERIDGQWKETVIEV